MPDALRSKVASIVRDAGGCVVGFTRLQKLSYLLSATGLEDGLSFDCRHYGPHSVDLANAVREAVLLGLLKETERTADWGGCYSTYVVGETSDDPVPPSRHLLAAEAVKADVIELELVATAVFLAKEGHSGPWSETARRKPEKAEGRLDGAKALYRRLCAIDTPIPLPAMA